MIEAQQIRHAELITCIRNSAHEPMKEGKFLWNVTDHLPKKIRDQMKQKFSVDGYMAAWDQFIAGFTHR